MLLKVINECSFSEKAGGNWRKKNLSPKAVLLVQLQTTSKCISKHLKYFKNSIYNHNIQKLMLASTGDLARVSPQVKAASCCSCPSGPILKFFYSPSKADIMSDCRVHELHRQTGLIELLLALGHVYTLQFTEQACGEINDGTIHLFKNWREKIHKIEQDYLEILLQVLQNVLTSKLPEIPPWAILHAPNSSFSWNEATFFQFQLKASN